VTSVLGEAAPIPNSNSALPVLLSKSSPRLLEGMVTSLISNLPFVERIYCYNICFSIVIICQADIEKIFYC